METQQRFEGSSVEEVLTEVRATLGVHAEILEANKIRKGGIGGFFAKETFEVIAAPGSSSKTLPAGIDEAAFDRAAEHVQRSSSVADLLDLADQVSGLEGQSAPSPTGPSRTATPFVAPTMTHQPPAPQPPAPQPLATQPAGAPPRIAQPAAQPATAQPGFEPLLAAEMPHLSTEGAPFNDVLQRIAMDASPEIADVIDRRMGATPAPGFGSAPQPQVPVAAPTQPSTQPPARPTMGTHNLTPVGPQARTAANLMSDLAVRTAELPAMPSAPSLQPVDPEPHSAATLEPTVDVGRTQRLLSWLERDNLPRTTLLTALRGLPEAPVLPDATGVVVVIVGERRAALRLCRQMAKAHESDPTDVVLASCTYRGSSIPTERRIIDLTDAARDRRSWHRRQAPTFVAVDSPASVTAHGLAWVSDVVTELEPHLVIGLTSAARKPEDIAAWAQGVGGLDALALTALDETTTPYAVLALEIPIAYLDDVAATPAEWAHLLLEGSDR